jgi:hypothetical protein
MGVVLVLKASIALAIPRRFYAERQRQYDSVSLPPKLMVPPIVIAAITSVAWYATIFHYQPWCWLVTAPLTGLACLSADHLIRWEKHRQSMHKIVSDPKVWRVDCLLFAIGIAFILLAFLVY